MVLKIDCIDDFNYRGKRVLLRVDINSPIDPVTKKIVNENRLDKSISTIRDLTERGAKLIMLAHQGDTLDYPNLISLKEHAQKLSQKLGKKVQFIDDVAGPAARERVKALKDGEILLLENVRFCTEEVSTFENDVKLTEQEMTETYLVRNLAPLVDYYVNDAFAAAHRNAPSMVAFQELLPSAGGRLLIDEMEALAAICDNPSRPCVFLLGGLKISDAFGIMRTILSEGTADVVLTSGVTGNVMLMAAGKSLGDKTETFIKNRSLDKFITPAREFLTDFPAILHLPKDLAVDDNGERREISVDDLPAEGLIVDLGERTLQAYEELLAGAGTIFVNGPAGVYENPVAEEGTRRLWSAIAEAQGYSVIGGGDTVASAGRFIDLNKIDFVSTGGGALIRYLSGQELPLLKAMQKAAMRRQRR